MAHWQVLKQCLTASRTEPVVNLNVKMHVWRSHLTREVFANRHMDATVTDP